MRRPRTPAEAQVVAFLEVLRWGEAQAASAGVAYRGPTDFVLQHGEWYDTILPPPERGMPKMCYGNAIAIAVRHGLGYVEGYAMPLSTMLPVQHAWNVDDAGRCIDATWGFPAVYAGVRFSLERADDCTWNGDANVLDDHMRGWPLLRQRWYGEPIGMAWPPSERLELLRDAVAGIDVTERVRALRA